MRVPFFYCLLYIVMPSYGQYEEKDFILHTTRQGLCDNFITSLQQDAQGYMWIGTESGLSRFDGHSFKNFFLGSAILTGSSPYIIKLKRFDANQLGIISRGGFRLLNTKDFSSRGYQLPDSTAFSNYLNYAWDAVQLPDKSFLLTTATGAYILDHAGNISFRHDVFRAKDLNTNRVLYGRDIYPLNNTEYLVNYEDTGVALFNLDKKIYREISKEDKKWMPFISPPISEGGGWIKHAQLNNDEYIFQYFRKDSIVYYNRASGKIIISPTPYHSFSVLGWQSVIVRLNDSIFAISERGNGFHIFHLDRNTGKITFNPNRFLPEHKVLSLFMDKDKRLWVGTNRGLLQQKLGRSQLQSFSFGTAPSANPVGSFSCALRYKDKLYLGRFSRNTGLMIVDPVTMKPERETSFFGTDNSWNEVLSMQCYHPDTLWLGTNAGTIWYSTLTHQYGKLTDPLTNEPVNMSVLAEANAEGQAWMCRYLEGAVARYDVATRRFVYFTTQTNPALPFTRVKSIAYDAYGDVWIGGHALARWNSRQEVFDTLITGYAGFNKYNDNILAISADSRGSLWLHNAHNGLLEYKIKERKFEVYTTRQGLPSDNIFCLSPVIDNRLWIGDNNHLTRYDIETGRILTYDQNDGMPDHRPTSRIIYYDRLDQQLYLLANTTVMRLPASQPQLPDHSSGLIVQELDVNGKEKLFHPDDDLQLSPGENNLTLYFTVIDFESAANYRFAYKMNESPDWIDMGQQKIINLSALSAGKYSLTLRGTAKSGEQKINVFHFSIASPFYKTGWFVAGAAALALAIGYLFYHFRIRHIRQKANVDKLLAQTEMKALHSQMNPHFIFNSLNSIREMILNNENKQASHYLSKFAQLIRMTLDQSSQSFISLRNTLDYLHRYIEMEKIRNEYFTYSITVEAALDQDETVLPPMLIQPFIENAIWHGVTASLKNIDINIQFKKENKYLVCTVEDNGIGIDQSMKNKENGSHLHNAHGVANVMNRIRLLNEKHDAATALTIIDKSNINHGAGTGTLVTLRLPLEMNEK